MYSFRFRFIFVNFISSYVIYFACYCLRFHFAKFVLSPQFVLSQNFSLDDAIINSFMGKTPFAMYSLSIGSVTKPIKRCNIFLLIPLRRPTSSILSSQCSSRFSLSIRANCLQISLAPSEGSISASSASNSSSSIIGSPVDYMKKKVL